VLRNKAEEIRNAIENVEGVVDLKVQQQIMVPQVEIHVRPSMAAQFGLTAGQILDTTNLYLKGLKVGEFFEDQNIFDVVVWGKESVRSNIDALRSLMIDTPVGGQVPLSEVADVYIAPTPNQITRELASRYTEVTCNVRGRDLGRVAKDIENRVNHVAFDPGYHPEILGEYAAQQASQNRILAMSIVAMVGIFLILYSDLGSARLAVIVFLGLPFALIGGIIGTFFIGGVLSLGSLIGFITVLGIAVRNCIMLISHYRHLELKEDMPFGRALVIRGAKERLLPILMTAMTTALALTPIIIGGSRPGQEIEYPLALVILGGLVSSTLLNLLVMPVIYWKFGETKKSDIV
jgi:Cu/Ag efflux pump CusA